MKLYEIEVTQNSVLIEKRVALSVYNCIWSVIIPLCNNKREYFIVVTEKYFDQFGNCNVKYRKGTFSFCKSMKIDTTNKSFLEIEKELSDFFLAPNVSK